MSSSMSLSLAMFLTLVLLLLSVAPAPASAISSTLNEEEKGSSSVSALFGNTLYRWDASHEVAEESTEKLLNNKKVIGVYFSASYCRPCVQFTPVLAKFYNHMKKNGKSFEIVWVSRDRSPEEFLAYFEKMPWLAATWENFQTVVAQTSGMYQLKGIPHLVLLNGADLSIISTNGRELVLRDQYGLQFPWRSRSLLALVPTSIKRYLSNMLPSNILKNVERSAFRLVNFVVSKVLNVAKKLLQLVLAGAFQTKQKSPVNLDVVMETDLE